MQDKKMDDTGWDKRIAESAFLIATDVQNSWVGIQGYGI
ncbi:glycerate kinase [Paenibacillus xerothermodurans]|nr:glycerate kinase [Paenibacillus xerothermodurans]